MFLHLVRRSTARLTLATTLAATLLPTTKAGADIIRRDDMLRGITMTRQQCAAVPLTVWLTVYGQDHCVRYYVSTAGGEGPRPVVFLQGDYFGNLDLTNRKWVNLVDAKDIDTGDLQKMADNFSRMTKTTAIYLGRIGVEGTSGNHMSRKTLLELHLMNGALDAIKQRHGFAGFHLVGQSGGSKLVGGLIGLRRDVACAVAGSGPMTVPGTPRQTDPSRAYFDVVETVPTLAQNRSMRLMLVTDPADKTVPLAQQAGFVDKMRRAGAHVPQFLVEATDDHHHGVVVYAQLIAAGCVHGRSDADISRAVSTMVKRAAEINQRKANEASAKAAGSIVQRQPVRDPRAPVGFNAGTTSK